MREVVKREASNKIIQEEMERKAAEAERAKEEQRVAELRKARKKLEEIDAALDKFDEDMWKIKTAMEALQMQAAAIRVLQLGEEKNE